MAPYQTPGVYIEEIPSFPPTVVQVATAIPAFIGYTEGGPTEPKKIESMVEYRDVFGGPANELPEFNIDSSGNVSSAEDIFATPTYKMYYMLQMYFANGGGTCYIISVGNYTDEATKVKKDDLIDGLHKLRKEDEPTLILYPDARSIDNVTDYHDLYIDAMKQCADLGDRFTICDLQPAASGSIDKPGDASSTFRDNIGTNNLKYGAAYYPDLHTSLTYEYPEDEITVHNDGTDMKLRYSEAAIEDDPTKEDTSLFHANNGADRDKYYAIKDKIERKKLVLPPSTAIAGVYAMVDGMRGVWKAPANVSLNRVSKPMVLLDRDDQDGLNVADNGKSINAIRKFSGKGIMVWGGRTLDGNSKEWKYISVRRFFNMVEESTKKASERFIFEPNDANTWVKVKSMIENFLTIQWRAGALMGAKADDAFYVRVGLGETMTQQHILDGKMIVEIGMAVVRPAEFIILRFSHKMIES